jgi:Uma2 family endonuclease
MGELRFARVYFALRGANHRRTLVDTTTQEVTRRRFTVHEYHRMGEVGILHEDDRVELIEGEIVEMASIGTRHFTCVNGLTRLLVRGVGDAAIVSVQNPVRLDERTEPQPDLGVLRVRDYRESLPMPEDVLFLIEVSDTTLSYDRGVKLPLYARAGIPEVWIVDLASELIERHTVPSANGYRSFLRAQRGETIEPAALPELAIRVDAVLG